MYLATKNDIAIFVDKTDFDERLKDLTKKVTSNNKKHLFVEKLQKFDSSFLLVKVTLIIMDHKFS